MRWPLWGAGLRGGTANAGALGIAELNHPVWQTEGIHHVTAAFGNSALYEGSDSAGVTFVVVKPTTVTYTGALEGAPNKVITLSAILKDSQGKPLAGRMVTFQVGTQSTWAMTDANGIAVTTLKLTQKQGSYSVITSYAPGAADAAKYAGSSDVDAFKLGK